MTAVDDWIADLAAGKYSDADQNLISRVAVAIAALQAIQSGIGGLGNPQAPNTVLAGPAIAPAAPAAFRGLAAADIPAILNAFGMAAGQAITPDQIAGLVGTTTNNSAQAGRVGEFVESVVTFAAPVNVVASGVAQNLASINLGAGDWTASGVVSFQPTAALTIVGAGMNTVTGTMPAPEREILIQANAASPISAPIPAQRFSLAAPATVFMVGIANFAAGTCAMYGFVNARRPR